MTMENIQNEAESPQHISVYRVLSALLAYPDEALLQALPELQGYLDTPWRARLEPLFTALSQAEDLISAQEQYVATFDRRPAHSLHLFEHIHGQSRDRGQAM